MSRQGRFESPTCTANCLKAAAIDAPDRHFTTRAPTILQRRFPIGVADAKNCLNVSAVAIVIFRYGMDVWLRVGRQAINRPKTARSSKFVRYTVRAWTLNTSLTTSSSYRKCSKRRILDHSARATSRLQIEDTTRCSRTALGLSCGSIMVSAADLNLR
jgi:hypothetical protein